jgi:U3 small nucleolar RNA-associated protein 13
MLSTNSQQDTSEITSFCLTPSGAHLLVFFSSMALRVYEVPSSMTALKRLVQPIRITPRAHDAPIHVCTADPTSTYFASGSADGIVKVWDIRRGFVTHVFKGHGGVVSALKFSYPRDPNSVVQDQQHTLRLFTASVDTKVRMFDLVAARESGRKGGAVKPEAILEGHHSVPRGLDVSADGRWLLSGGRDSVALLWDLTGGKTTKNGKNDVKGKDKAIVPTLVRTIPVLERVEAVGLLAPDEEVAGSSCSADWPRFFTAGEKGVVKVWEARSSSILCTLGVEQEDVSEDQEEQRQIIDAM